VLWLVGRFDGQDTHKAPKNQIAAKKHETDKYEKLLFNAESTEVAVWVEQDEPQGVPVSAFLNINIPNLSRLTKRKQGGT